MERSAVKQFKAALDKAFTTQPNVKLNSSTMSDANKLKQQFKEESLNGGLADKKTLRDVVKKHIKKSKTQVEDMMNFLKGQLKDGMKVEMEHTKDKGVAKEIALDHLWEDPNYYIKLKKIETKKGGKREHSEATGTGSSGAFSGPIAFKDSDFLRKSFAETPKLKESMDKIESNEATTSGSVGGYVTPSAWAKSTKKKHWGPSRKSQIPGGAFVKVKKKCTKFPYCNQGDINALKITKNESVKRAIKSVSEKYNIKESIIISILEEELTKISKRKSS